MSLSNATIVAEPTSIVVNGTPDLSFTEGQNSGNSMVLYQASPTDYRLRKSVKATAILPRVSPSSPGGFTQQKTILVLAEPMLLANGKITNNTISISVFCDPELSPGNREKLLDRGAQLILDADFRSLLKDGTLA